MNDKTAKLTVYVPEEMIRALKHRAVDEGKTLSELVTEIIKNAIRS